MSTFIYQINISVYSGYSDTYSKYNFQEHCRVIIHGIEFGCAAIWS